MLLLVFCIISAFIIANGLAQSVEEVFPAEHDTNNITTAVFKEKNSVLNVETCNEELPECINTGGYCTSILEGDALQCVCPEGTSYYTEAGCKVTDKLCDEKSPDCRKTKGFCILSGGDVSCYCPDNSVFLEGQGCYVPSEVCDAKIPTCAKTGGTCIVEEDTRNVICICPENLFFDETEGCQESKITEDECESQKPKCISTDGFCKQRNGKVVCICPPETEYGKGGCKVNQCKRKCGIQNGVVCYGRIFDEKSVTCRCKDSEREFVSKSEGCRVNQCKRKCGVLEGVTCSGNIYGEESVTCTCNDSEKEFVNKSEGCRVNQCKRKCGDLEGVTCSGDFYDEEGVTCTCSDSEREFVNKLEGCRVNQCERKCGDLEGVTCSGDFYDEERVTCTCSDSEREFVNKSEGCRVNQCKIKCGDLEGVTCSGDFYDEESVTCTCSDSEREFVNKSEGCRAFNFCVEVCGTSPGVQCIGNITKKEEVVCRCRSNNEFYDSLSKECKVITTICDEELKICRLSGGTCFSDANDRVKCRCPGNRPYRIDRGCSAANFCIEACGNKKGVDCVWDFTYKKEVRCLCRHKDEIYDSLSKECKVMSSVCSEKWPKCRITGGTCFTDANRNVKCKCPGEKQYKMETGCAVANFCVEVCGTERGVECIGNFTDKEDIVCICHRSDEIHDSVSKKCKVLAHVCNQEWPKCLTTNGTCFRDDDGNVECKCPGEKQYRIETGCAAAVANFCVEVCGTKRGVQCIGDQKVKEKIRCVCSRKDEFYDSNSQQCQVLANVCNQEWPKCLKTNGTCIRDDDGNIECKCPGEKQYRIETGCAVLAHVCNQEWPKCLKTNGTCFRNDDGKIECKCPGEKQYRIETGCAVANFCEEVCGTKRGVQCIGDLKGKEKVRCVCSRKDEIYDSSSKQCQVLAHVCNQERPKCRKTNGTCFRDDDGNIECKCPGEKLYRIETGCAVANFCVEVCGTKRGVQCIGDLKVKEKVRCVCSRKDEFYDSSSKQCQVLAHVCNQEKPKCRITGGACFRDADDNIECKCPGKRQYRIETGCAVGNFCTEVCGTKRGVLCIGDVADKKKIDCVCLSKNEIYDQHSKECRDACSFMPCLNGGTCFVYKDTFKCTCDGTFTGERCQIIKSDDAKKTNILIWILCSIIIHLILIISCLAFSRCRSHLKEKNNC